MIEIGSISLTHSIARRETRTLCSGWGWLSRFGAELLWIALHACPVLILRKLGLTLQQENPKKKKKALFAADIKCCLGTCCVFARVISVFRPSLEVLS